MMGQSARSPFAQVCEILFLLLCASPLNANSVFFDADSTQERDRWVEVIQGAIKGDIEHLRGNLDQTIRQERQGSLPGATRSSTSQGSLPGATRSSTSQASQASLTTGSISVLVTTHARTGVVTYSLPDFDVSVNVATRTIKIINLTDLAQDDDDDNGNEIGQGGGGGWVVERVEPLSDNKY